MVGITTESVGNSPVTVVVVDEVGSIFMSCGPCVPPVAFGGRRCWSLCPREEGPACDDGGFFGKKGKGVAEVVGFALA